MNNVNEILEEIFGPSIDAHKVTCTDYAHCPHMSETQGPALLDWEMHPRFHVKTVRLQHYRRKSSDGRTDGILAGQCDCGKVYYAYQRGVDDETIQIHLR